MKNVSTSAYDILNKYEFLYWKNIYIRNCAKKRGGITIVVLNVGY